MTTGTRELAHASIGPGRGEGISGDDARCEMPSLLGAAPAEGIRTLASMRCRDPGFDRLTDPRSQAGS